MFARRYRMQMDHKCADAASKEVFRATELIFCQKIGVSSSASWFWQYFGIRVVFISYTVLAHVSSIAFMYGQSHARCQKVKVARGQEVLLQQDKYGE